MYCVSISPSMHGPGLMSQSPGWFWLGFTTLATGAAPVML